MFVCFYALSYCLIYSLSVGNHGQFYFLSVVNSESVSLYFLFVSHIGFKLLLLATRNSISCLLWVHLVRSSLFSICLSCCPWQQAISSVVTTVISSPLCIWDHIGSICLCVPYILYRSSSLVTGICLCFYVSIQMRSFHLILFLSIYI